MHYLRDPKEIYRQSFASIRAEADLGGLGAEEELVAIRLIHACGMPDIVPDLVFSPRAMAAGKEALERGAPVICDVNMLANGIITRMLPAQNRVLCGLDLPEAEAFARRNRHTRTAGGIEALRHELGGAILAFGNAPTALFHLLELVAEGAAPPALILGFPVGFVGARESKQALIDNDLGLEFVALRGRRGGSALAAAALNALASGLET